jgi:hypothetical protein
MKGVEIEANYDARFLYIGGTVTRIDTDFADSFTSPVGRDIADQQRPRRRRHLRATEAARHTRCGHPAAR